MKKPSRYSILALFLAGLFVLGVLIMRDTEEKQQVRIQINPSFGGFFEVFLLDSRNPDLYDAWPENADPIDAIGQRAAIVKDTGEPGKMVFAFVSTDAADGTPKSRIFRNRQIGTFNVYQDIETLADGTRAYVEGSGAQITYLMYEIAPDGDCTTAAVQQASPRDLFEALLR